MLRIQDTGELLYGGLVTLTEWWDRKRIKEAKLKNTEILKKAGFYSYAVIGVVATLMSAFGWMRRYNSWEEHISHGFTYDLPRFGLNLFNSLSKNPTYGNMNAIEEANRIREARQKQLGSGQGAKVPNYQGARSTANMEL